MPRRRRTSRTVSTPATADSPEANCWVVHLRRRDGCKISTLATRPRARWPRASSAAIERPRCSWTIRDRWRHESRTVAKRGLGASLAAIEEVTSILDLFLWTRDACPSPRPRCPHQGGALAFPIDGSAHRRIVRDGRVRGDAAGRRHLVRVVPGHGPGDGRTVLRPREGAATARRRASLLRAALPPGRDAHARRSCREPRRCAAGVHAPRMDTRPVGDTGADRARGRAAPAARYFARTAAWPAVSAQLHVPDLT